MCSSYSLIVPPTLVLYKLCEINGNNNIIFVMIMLQTTMRLEEDDQWFSLVHAQVGERPYTIVRRVGEDSDTMDVVRSAVTTVFHYKGLCVSVCARAHNMFRPDITLALL